MIHVREVDGGELVRGLVVVVVQVEARDCLRDDALASEGDVVGAQEESFGGAGILDQGSAVAGEGWAEVGPAIASEPEVSGRDGGIGPADHFKLEVGDDRGEIDGWMGEEGTIAEAANLLGAEEREDHGAAKTWAGGEEAGEGEHGGGSGGVVIGAVIDEVGIGFGRVRSGYAEVIEVGGEQDDFSGGRSREDSDGVPGVGAGHVFKVLETLLQAIRKRGGEWALLKEGSVMASGSKAKCLKARGCVEGGEVFVAGAGAAATEFIGGQEGEVGSKIEVDCSILGRDVRSGWGVEGESDRRPERVRERECDGEPQVSWGAHGRDYRGTAEGVLERMKCEATGMNQTPATRLGKMFARLLLGVGLMTVVGCAGFFVKPTSSGSGTGTGTLTPTQAGDWVYVANAAAMTVTGYAVGTSTLSSRTGSPYSLGYIPTAAVVARTNTFLYVAGPGAVYVYAIASDGSLSASSSGAGVAIATVLSLAVSPDGKWLFGLDATTQTLDEWSINATTGALTTQSGATYTVTSGVVQPRSLKVSPDGNYVFAALGTGGDLVFSLTTSTGVVTVSQELATGSTLTSDNAVAVNSTSSVVYVARSGLNGGVAAYSIGTAGVLNALTGSPFAAGSGPFALTFSGTGTYLYVANRTDGTISGFKVASGGALTALSGSPYAAGTLVSSLATDNTGAYVVAGNFGGTPDVGLYTISSTTQGALISAATVPSGTTASGALAVATSY